MGGGREQAQSRPAADGGRQDRGRQDREQTPSTGRDGITNGRQGGSTLASDAGRRAPRDLATGEGGHARRAAIGDRLAAPGRRDGRSGGDGSQGLRGGSRDGSGNRGASSTEGYLRALDRGGPTRQPIHVDGGRGASRSEGRGGARAGEASPPPGRNPSREGRQTDPAVRDGIQRVTGHLDRLQERLREERVAQRDQTRRDGFSDVSRGFARQEVRTGLLEQYHAQRNTVERHADRAGSIRVVMEGALPRLQRAERTLMAPAAERRGTWQQMRGVERSCERAQQRFPDIRGLDVLRDAAHRLGSAGGSLGERNAALNDAHRGMRQLVRELGAENRQAVARVAPADRREVRDAIRTMEARAGR